MLEQAFIDASALREAALKSAETEVINKYSLDIKEAVSKILEEAPEDEMELEEPGMEVEPEEAGTIEAPLASTEGETLCACPDDEQEITVDVDELLAMADEMEPEIDAPLQEEIEIDEEIMMEFLSAGDDLEEGEKMPMKDDTEEDLDNDGKTDDEVPAFLDEEIELELDEELLEKVNLDVQTGGEKFGWKGTADSLVEYEAELEAARMESTEAKEEAKEIEEKLAALQKENKEFRSVIMQMKDKLDEVNLANAKLLYTNRVLDSSSLNERQRKRIVEAITKADSPNEAKVIFDTLQSAVGMEATSRPAPKSLSEAVSRPSSILSVRKEEKVNPYANRMKILAGIKNSN
jgi:hypothetical protein